MSANTYLAAAAAAPPDARGTITAPAQEPSTPYELARDRLARQRGVLRPGPQATAAQRAAWQAVCEDAQREAGSE